VTATAVTVRGLSAAYADQRGPVAVLEDLEFELAPGERLAVVGQSGGGKSTLLHVLAGLLAPTSGEVRIGVSAGGDALSCVDAAVGAAGPAIGAGVAGRAASPTGRAASPAAYMFQHDLLLAWKTVLDNVVFAAEMAARGSCARAARASLRAQAADMLEEFGLGGVLNALPSELSGGMRQRVALARTLLLGRGLVLLDEPFGSLDALTRAEMQSWLLDVMATHPATWVLVTHDVREAVLLGDKVAVLAGRPARLEGWVDVPLTAAERRGLAALETGGPLSPAADAGRAGSESAVCPRPSAIDLDAAAHTMAQLAARVRAQLGQRRA